MHFAGLPPPTCRLDESQNDALPKPRLVSRLRIPWVGWSDASSSAKIIPVKIIHIPGRLGHPDAVRIGRQFPGLEETFCKTAIADMTPRKAR